MFPTGFGTGHGFMVRVYLFGLSIEQEEASGYPRCKEQARGMVDFTKRNKASIETL